MESVGEILYFRGEKGSGQEDEDDIWDDRALVEAYDSAVKSAKDKIAKRLGIENTSGTESASSKTNCDEKRKMKKKRPDRKKQWEVDDPCRAIYLKDSLIYEATIEKIEPEIGMCTVRYIGYENVEEVPIKSLLPSEGKRARKLQIQQALLDEMQDETVENGYESSSKGSGMECSGEAKKSKHSKPAKSSHSKMEGDFPAFPPFTQDKPGGEWFSPPLFPSGKFPSNGHFQPMGMPTMPIPVPPPPFPLTEECSEADSQALSAMLMAWFMSGFHTGYYHGLKQAKMYPHSRLKPAENQEDKTSRRKKSR